MSTRSNGKRLTLSVVGAVVAILGTAGGAFAWASGRLDAAEQKADANRSAIHAAEVERAQVREALKRIDRRLERLELKVDDIHAQIAR